MHESRSNILNDQPSIVKNERLEKDCKGIEI